MGLVQTVAPVVEPITLTEAKDHLRVDISDDDTLINALIEAARARAETETHRQFITATFEKTLDFFPNVIWLEKPKVQSVSSIQYIDTAGTTQTLPAAEFRVDVASEPARIEPAFGFTWPITRPIINAVTVTYVAGYGLAAAVPEALKSAMKLLIGDMYENREEQIAGIIISMNSTAAKIFNNFIVRTVF